MDRWSTNTFAISLKFQLSVTLSADVESTESMFLTAFEIVNQEITRVVDFPDVASVRLYAGLDYPYQIRSAGVQCIEGPNCDKYRSILALGEHLVSHCLPHSIVFML